MLTGDTGTGKTALLRELSVVSSTARRHRILYFSESAQARCRRPGQGHRRESCVCARSMCHSVNLDRLLRALSEESHTILLWLDEAHDLSGRDAGRGESSRQRATSTVTRRIRVMFVGLPRLRAEMQRPSLSCGVASWYARRSPAWYSTRCRTFSITTSTQLREQAAVRARPGSTLFERAGGAPGLLLPMYRAAAQANSPR